MRHQVLKSVGVALSIALIFAIVVLFPQSGAEANYPDSTIQGDSSSIEHFRSTSSLLDSMTRDVDCISTPYEYGFELDEYIADHSLVRFIESEDREGQVHFVPGDGPEPCVYWGQTCVKSKPKYCKKMTGLFCPGLMLIAMGELGSFCYPIYSTVQCGTECVAWKDVCMR